MDRIGKYQTVLEVIHKMEDEDSDGELDNVIIKFNKSLTNATHHDRKRI